MWFLRHKTGGFAGPQRQARRLGRSAAFVASGVVALACTVAQGQIAGGTSNATAVKNSPIILKEIVVTEPRFEAGLSEGSATNGYRSSTGSVGPLGNMPLKDTPYSLHVTSGELIVNRVSHDPTDALKTDPTVMPLMSPDAGGGGAMNRVMVRGFTAADQSTLRDGLSDRSFTWDPIENVQRIEVLDGFSGFLYGFSALGGAVNYVSKQPTDKPMLDLTAGFYENRIFFEQVDAGGPLTDALGYRVNLYNESGDTFRDDSTQTRDLESVALRYRLSDNTALHFSFYEQTLHENGLASYFDPSGIGNQVPTAFDPGKQYGQPWTYNNSEKHVETIGLDSQLDDTFALRVAYLRGDMWRQYAYIRNKFTDSHGDYTETVDFTPRQTESTDAAYALMDATFDTWGIGHTLTYGYTYWDYTFSRGPDNTALLGASSIAAPVCYAPPPYASPGDTGCQTMYVQNGILGDSIAFDPQWSLLAGLNATMTHTSYHGSYYSTSKDITDQSFLSPTVGLVYKVVPDVTLYASYMQGVQAGTVAPAGTQNAETMVPATGSDQLEAGIKATIAKTFDLSLAAFRMDMQSYYTDPVDNVYKAIGREVHQGVELVGSGKICDRLTLVGGITAMSAKIEQAATAIDGSIPVNVPERSARLYLEYELPRLEALPGVLTLTAGTYYYGQRPVNTPNTEFLEGVALFDAGLRYQPTSKLTFNLNVTNLADTRYWSYDRGGTDGLLLGDPRMIAFSIKYSF
jgi:iron complex outermembrane receptor protein